MASIPEDPRDPEAFRKVIFVGILIYVTLRCAECYKLTYAAAGASGAILFGLTVGFIFIGALAFTVGSAWSQKVKGAASCHWMMELLLIPPSCEIGLKLAENFAVAGWPQKFAPICGVIVALLIQGLLAWMGHLMISEFAKR
jgi:hypothetical protein